MFGVTKTVVLASEISADRGPLIDQLTGLGLRIDGSEYGPRGVRRIFRLERIFSHHQGSEQDPINSKMWLLETLGLFRAFDSRVEFGAVVLEHAKTIV